MSSSAPHLYTVAGWVRFCSCFLFVSGQWGKVKLKKTVSSILIYRESNLALTLNFLYLRREFPPGTQTLQVQMRYTRELLI